ncbi:MAG: hypothetical protein BWY75_02247 [bacterium ADurb.Bin425]|nr:MAG: hypothetical protein BWY75_02247 [bacterium ADurb.Bin425]
MFIHIAQKGKGLENIGLDKDCRMNERQPGNHLFTGAFH